MKVLQVSEFCHSQYESVSASLRPEMSRVHWGLSDAERHENAPRLPQIFPDECPPQPPCGGICPPTGCWSRHCWVDRVAEEEGE
jgi:hypothetical protein